MRILIDTNIFIYREDPKVIPENLQKLLRILNENHHSIYLHPASFKDIERDRDVNLRDIMLSKIKAYPILDPAPLPDDTFLLTIGKNGLKASTTNDHLILYAVFRNAVDILITEDKEIINNAVKIGIESSVMDISNALIYFENIHSKKPISHVIIKEEPVYNININDPIFDSLREDYTEFSKWFEKISREGRKCWVYKDDERTKAILIFKEEEEPIDTNPPLPKKKRLKIATLKVDLAGFRIGELLLKLSIKYCINNNIDEIYLTHFVKESDALVKLIEDFGFLYHSNNQRGEAVYIKKFIVPIRPEYHDLLFQDYEKRQWKITEYVNINPQGNTLKKAYLSNSTIKKINSGDILLFYRSQDEHKITSLGIVETIYPSMSDTNELWRIIGSNRSVYTKEEIVRYKKPLTIIIFRHHFNLKTPITLKELVDNNVLSSAPQSITEITDESYRYIKNKGGIDARFTFG